MPSRMAGSSSLSFPARETTSLGSPRARRSSLSPSSGGMSGRPCGRAWGRVAVPSRPSARKGAQNGMGGGMPMSGGKGVMPPSFGYPFRQPPSLLSPSAASMGMSM